MADTNQPPPPDGTVTPGAHPATATVHPPTPAEPTLEELQADMEASTPEAHQVPKANREVETTQQAGEYVLPPPKTPKKEG